MLSGKEFNALFPNTIFVKVIRSNYTGSMGQVKLGLNTFDGIPKAEPIPSEVCTAKNGFYFSSKEEIWDDLYDSYIVCSISIPDDALVTNFHRNWSYQSCMVSNKIIVNEFSPLKQK